MIINASDPDARFYLPILNEHILNNVIYADEGSREFRYVDPCDWRENLDSVHEVVNVDIKIYRIDSPMLGGLTAKKFGCQCETCLGFCKT